LRRRTAAARAQHNRARATSAPRLRRPRHAHAAPVPPVCRLFFAAPPLTTAAAALSPRAQPFLLRTPSPRT